MAAPDFESGAVWTVSTAVDIEFTQEIEKKFYPFYQNQWLVSRIGRSLVLGPNETKLVYLPFRVHVNGSAVNGAWFRDCLSHRAVRSWVKVRSDGQLQILLRNMGLEAAHVPPRSAVCMIHASQYQCRDNVGVAIELALPKKRKQEFGGAVEVQGLTLQTLKERFPCVFDLFAAQ